MDLPVRRKQNRFYGGLGAGMTGAWWQGLGKGGVEQREREMVGIMAVFVVAETQCSQNLLKSTKVILMRTPCNGVYRVSTSHLLQQERLPRVGLENIQLSYWQRGSHGNQQPRLLLRQKDYSLKTDIGVLLLRKTCHNLLKVKRLSWCLQEDLTPMCQSLWCEKVLCKVLKCGHEFSTKPLTNSL